MWTAFLLVFITGILNRIADMVADDGLKLSNNYSYPIGAVYGLLIAYTISIYPVLAPLAIAVLLSCVFTGKIDSEVHYLGIGTFLFFIYIFGLPPVQLLIFIGFLAAGILDETGNRFADEKRFRGALGWFFGLRLTMEVSAFLISLITGEWIFFLAIVFYDLGFTYIFAGRRFGRKILNKRRANKVI